MAKISAIKELVTGFSLNKREYGLVIGFSLNKRELLIWKIYIAQPTKLAFPSIIDLDPSVKISISSGDFSFPLISWLKILSGLLLSLASHPEVISKSVRMYLFLKGKAKYE